MDVLGIKLFESRPLDGTRVPVSVAATTGHWLENSATVLSTKMTFQHIPRISGK